MVKFGRGMARRPPRGGAAGMDAAHTAPSHSFIPGEAVYIVPGVPNGISPSELAGLPSGLQALAMEAWYRANFRPARSSEISESRFANTELADQFQAIVPEPVRNALSVALGREAAAWVVRYETAQFSAEARLGIVIAPTDFRTPKVSTLKAEILQLIEAGERALSALEPLLPGLGHNGPPDALSRSEYSEATQALIVLRQEISSTQVDVGRVHRAAQVVTRVAAIVGKWLWKRAETAIDQTIKLGVPPFLVWIGGKQLGAWQDLQALGDALARWITALGG